MNPRYTKGITFIVLLISIFVSRTIADSKREIEECPQQFVGQETCLAKSPPPDCCSGLEQVLKNNEKCLCPQEECANEFGSADADDAYSTWLRKYPSALTSFEKITNQAKGKRIALFLDYDGTLSPIVSNPDCAFMSENMRAAVKKAAEYFPTAIISGRSRDKVYNFVGLPELYYAGSHGMDIIGPVRQSVSDNHPNCIRSTDKQGKEVNLCQPAAEFLPMIAEVLTLLVDRTKDIEGAKVENNTFCVSVHYRNVNEKNWDTVEQCVRDILKDYPRLRLTRGRKVLEIRPAIDWDKGKAVTFLLESLGLNNCEDVLPIHVGDDQTDEDAFKVLRKETRGYGILVSSKPKETNAVYSLRDPSEVMEFLKSLVALQAPERPHIVYRIIDTWFVLAKSLLATVNSFL